MSDPDPTAAFENLRRETAQMLDYDYANLTAAESVRTDRAAMIRLELDDCLAKKLANQPFDMVKFIVASKELEIMVGGTPDAPVSFDVDGVIADLEQSIQGIIDVRQFKAAEAESNPAGGIARPDGAVTLPASVEQPAATAGGTPVLISPVPPPPPASQRETAEEKMARVNSSGPPAHYLKQYDPALEIWKRSPWSFM